MIEYIDILNKTTDLKDYQNISVAFNNHFAGFGPQSANTFLKLMDKPEIDGWTNELEKEQQNSTKQELKYHRTFSKTSVLYGVCLIYKFSKCKCQR